MTGVESKYQFADGCRRFIRRKVVALPETLKVMKNGGGKLRRDEQSSVTQTVKQVTKLVTIDWSRTSHFLPERGALLHGNTMHTV